MAIKQRVIVVTNSEGRMVCPICRKVMVGWPLKRSAHCGTKDSYRCLGWPETVYTPEALADFLRKCAA